MFGSILEHIKEYIDLTDLEIEQFTSVLIVKKLRKRQFLIEEGDRVNYQYYVVSGCLKAYEVDGNGEEHIIQFARENWWISDFKAFFDQGQSRLNIDAIEESTVIAIEKNDLEELYLKVPKFERFFRIKLTRAYVALQNRILSSLEKTNEEQYLEFQQAYPNIEQRIPNYMIANYLGIKPESLSRIRKRLISR